MRYIITVLLLLTTQNTFAECAAPQASFIEVKILHCKALTFPKGSYFSESDTNKTVMLTVKVIDGFDNQASFKYDNLSKTEHLGKEMRLVLTQSSLYACPMAKRLQSYDGTKQLYITQACCDTPPHNNGNLACQYDQYWADDFDTLTRPVKRKPRIEDYHSNKYDF